MKKNLKEHIEVDNREEQDFIFHSIVDYFTSISVELPLNEELEKIEKARIASALNEHKGNRTQASLALGMGRTLLIHKIKKYNLY